MGKALRDDHIDSAKQALLALFESKPADEGVWLSEFTSGLPEDITGDETQAAIDQLESDRFVQIEDCRDDPMKSRFIKGPLFQKWKPRLEGTQETATWDLSAIEFPELDNDPPEPESAVLDLEDDNTLNLQLSESDSQAIIELIEKMTADPKAKQKASIVLKAWKSGATGSAKEAVEQLFHLFT